MSPKARTKEVQNGMPKQTSAQCRLASSLVEKIQLQGRPSQVKFAVNIPNSGTFFLIPQVLDLRTVQEFTLHPFPAVADTFNSLMRYGSKPNVHPETSLHPFPAVADTFNSLMRYGSKPNVHSKDNTTKFSSSS